MGEWGGDPELWPKENRALLGVLGALGFLETGFLTYEKVFVGDLSTLCSVGEMSLRCGDVLNSEYAEIFGECLLKPANAQPVDARLSRERDTCSLSSNILPSTGIPLTLPATLAYGAVAVLAVLPFFSSTGPARREADRQTRDPLLVRRTHHV